MPKVRRGSHHIFVHPEVPEPLNLQDIRGQAKPYQIRQLLRLVERYRSEPGGRLLSDYYINVF